MHIGLPTAYYSLLSGSCSVLQGCTLPMTELPLQTQESHERESRLHAFPIPSTTNRMKSFSSAAAAYSRGVFAILGLSLIAALLVVRSGTTRDADSLSYYSDTLREARIVQHVRIEGQQYNIDSGAVSRHASSEPLTEEEALAALRLAYAKTIAQYNPPASLAGTDLALLDTAIL